MIDWLVRFQTFQPLASFPELMIVSGETQDSERYHFRGVDRRHEAHCALQVTLAGRGRFTDASGPHDLPPGTGFLCAVSDPKTSYGYPPEASEPWRFVYAAFQGPTALAMVSELTARFGHVVDLGTDSPLVERLTSYRQAHGQVVSLSPGAGAQRVMQILADVQAGRRQDASPDAGRDLARRAVQLIRRRSEQNLNASQLAGELGVSREHLTRVFGRQLGQSPYRFILRERMLQACQLLKDTSLTTGQIALRLGYAAPAHFSRTFRNVIGMTPSRFRRGGTMPIR